jgi:hypothetical protein
MLKLYGLRQARHLSLLYNSASFLRMMSTTSTDPPSLFHSGLLSPQGQEERQAAQATQDPGPVDVAIKNAVIGSSTASGRPVEPRRIKFPIAVAPMVDVTTSV